MVGEIIDIKITSRKHRDGYGAWYSLLVNNCTQATYEVNFIKKTTVFIIYHDGFSVWGQEETMDEVIFEFNSAIPLDEYNPIHTVERLNKLLILK